MCICFLVCKIWAHKWYYINLYQPYEIWHQDSKDMILFNAMIINGMDQMKYGTFVKYVLKLTWKTFFHELFA